MLAATADERQLSLRAVAREVGVAAPSVYLHFASKFDLIRAVSVERFADLDRMITAAQADVPADDPVGRVHALCHAYCRFAEDQPMTYRVLLSSVPARMTTDAVDEGPGGDLFARLVADLEACPSRHDGVPRDPVRAAVTLWTSLHGIVSLRLAVPGFPWPPRDQQVEDALAAVVHRSTDDAR